MDIYCRLCAELKGLDEIATTITDTENLIEQKLTACCQWNVENSIRRLPQEVCTYCLDRLNKSWLFSQRVQSAQYKLEEIFDKTDNGIKSETHTKELTNFETIEISFDCTVCLKSFSSRIDLKEHGCNKGVEVDQCYRCHRTFKSLNALRIHCEKQSENTCRICSKIFCESHALMEHEQQGCENADSEQKITTMRQYDIDDIKVELSNDIVEGNEPFLGESPLLAPIESNVQTSTKSRKKYAIKRDENVKYDCYLCNERFSKFLFLKRHMEIHTLPKTLKCDYCHAKFRSDRALTAHKNGHRPGVPPKPKFKKRSIEINSDELNYQCYICKKKLAKFEYVKTHMHVHTVPKTLKCEYCRCTFRTMRYLNQHIRTHIDFICDVCHKTFPSGRTLKLHKRVHVGDANKLYGCEMCDHFFKDLSTYCQHMKAKHGMERPEAKQIAKIVEPNGSAKKYVCERCGSSFREECGLKMHLLVHTEVRDHRCDICSKGFKSAYTLKAHKIMHQDEKKFKCELCDNAYKRKSSLQIHLAVHAAKINKRFPCDLCTETFLHRSEMVVHRSTHTGDRVYKCDICNYATRHRGDIGAHKRTLIHLEALKKLSEAQQ